MKLPYIKVKDSSTLYNRHMSLETFGGYTHTLSAENGAIYDMKNLTGDYYPKLSTRSKRNVDNDVTKPHGIFSADALYMVDGTTLYKDGVSIGTVADSDKRFCALGERVIIFPDKKVYEDGTLKNLESSISLSNVTFKDGTYAKQEAKANTIYKSGVNWSDYFKEGDAVTISGCTSETKNNKTPIIREIDGAELRFYENVFTLPDESTSYTESSVTIARTVPDLDFICTNENRVWGCKGDTIYASKLGDPYNWNVFDGVATDSFSVDSGTAGDFTACISFLGYPIFFKEDRILKVYGSYPSNFQTSASATLGVAVGSSKSMAIAGETLYYLSRAGIVAYAGGIPQSIASVFGDVKYKNAVGGSDGLKYYVSMQDASNAWNLFVYDSQKQLWHKEDTTKVHGMAYHGGLKALTDSKLLTLDSDGNESSFESVAEFGDFTYSTLDYKHLVRMKLRLEIATGSTLSIYVKFDNGEYRLVNTLNAMQKGLYFQPIIIQRCDHFRIKLVGQGEWKLHAIDMELHNGGRR